MTIQLWHSFLNGVLGNSQGSCSTLVSTQRSTILYPLHTKQALPRYPKGSTESHCLPIAVRNVPISHSSKTLSSARTETTMVCSLLPVIPHKADPSPTSQSQCFISHKAGSLSTKQFPTFDCFHGQQPFPGCANSQTPMGAKTQRVHNPEKN